MNCPALDTQVHAINGDKAGKILGQILCFEDRIVTHTRRPLVAHSWQVFALGGKAY